MTQEIDPELIALVPVKTRHWLYAFQGEKFSHTHADAICSIIGALVRERNELKAKLVALHDDARQMDIQYHDAINHFGAAYQLLSLWKRGDSAIEVHRDSFLAEFADRIDEFWKLNAADDDALKEVTPIRWELWKNGKFYAVCPNEPDMSDWANDLEMWESRMWESRPIFANQKPVRSFCTSLPSPEKRCAVRRYFLAD